MPRHSLPRRTFLKAAGTCLALPALESLGCAETSEKKASGSQPPRRMVCIGNEFGMYPGSFWPKTTGPDYEITPLLKPVEPHRKDLTVFSHLDHGLKGGHFAVHTFLTGVKAAEAKAMPEGGISLDQLVAFDQSDFAGRAIEAGGPGRALMTAGAAIRMDLAVPVQLEALDQG